MILSKFFYCHQAARNVQLSFRSSLRRSFTNGFLLNQKASKPVSNGIRLLSGLTFSATLGYKALHSTVVDCKKSSRVVQRIDDDENRRFNWGLFLKFLRPDWFTLLIAVISALLVAAFNIQIPIYLGEVVSVLTACIREQTSESFTDAVKLPALKLLLLYSAQSFFTFIYIASLSHVGERLASRLREALFTSIIKQDLAYFDKTKTGEIMNTLSGDVQEFKSSFKQCIAQGLRSFAQTIGCACSLYLMNPKMTLFVLAVIPIVMGIGTFIGAGLRKLSNEAQRQTAHAAGVADEAIANIRTVRAFAMEDTEVQLFYEELRKSQHANSILGLGIGAFQALTNVTLNGIVLGVLFVGGKLINEGEITAGNLMSFMVATQMIERNLSHLFLLFGQYVKGLASGARVFEMMEMKSLIPLRGGITIPHEGFAGEIRLRNVNFSYPTRPNQKVLDHLNLSIPPGKVVALCGASGSGKSTVAALVERFYDVDDGEVLIDGVNVKDLDLTWLRGSTIGFISQEPVLFATSILENIRYGRPGASDAEVMEAARQANAHDFIMSFEGKYNTVLGERGVTVSGGQKQRIAIARALLKNPQILILDEATSALDTQSEQVVQQTLDQVIKGRTVLVIAHRLSTIRKADIIYVMQHGKIIESGDHTTLTALKGAYWRLTQDLQEEEKTRPDSKSFFRNGR